MTTAKINYLLDTGGYQEQCNTCKHFRELYQNHPYGSTTASEDISECVCPDDSQCPLFKQPRFEIGQRYNSPGKHSRICTIVDILTTFNSQGLQVGLCYITQHDFCGQTVTEYDVCDSTIARGLIN